LDNYLQHSVQNDVPNINAKLTTAQLERLTHQCHIIEMGIDSISFKQSHCRCQGGHQIQGVV